MTTRVTSARPEPAGHWAQILGIRPGCSSSSSVAKDVCYLRHGFEVGQFGRSAATLSRASGFRGQERRGAEQSAGGISTVGRGTSGAVMAPDHDDVREPGDSDQRLVARGPPRRRPRVRAPLRALPPADPRLRARDGQRPRPRGGRDPGGLRLRAAPDARDRAAARLQALALPDRQERLHRRVPPLQAHRGGLLRRRRRPRARRSLASSSAPAPRPTPRSRPSRTSTASAARSAASRRPTTRSSSCASSRASPTRRSAAAWA